MTDKKKREKEWTEAKRKCRLNAETVRMAKELGLNPRKLIRNIPNKRQRWKAPLHVWIRDMYEERMDGAARRPPGKKTQQNAMPNKVDETTGDDLRLHISNTYLLVWDDGPLDMDSFDEALF